jgi:hypothetical protein
MIGVYPFLSIMCIFLSNDPCFFYFFTTRQKSASFWKNSTALYISIRILENAYAMQDRIGSRSTLFFKSILPTQIKLVSLRQHAHPASHWNSALRVSLLFLLWLKCCILPPYPINYNAQIQLIKSLGMKLADKTNHAYCCLHGSEWKDFCLVNITFILPNILLII